MERDLRRGHGSWRGCYSFKDMVCEGTARPDRRRVGGLKMGHTYYYYYEVDGSTETFDPSMPSTTCCPYMPGQTVNTLNVPTERTTRYRSASMNSMRRENFRTMDPEARFTNPKPLPAVPSVLRQCATNRSSSPASSWKKLFGRKTHHRSSTWTSPSPSIEDAPSRSLSPDSLPGLPRESALCSSQRPSSSSTERPTLTIPDEIIPPSNEIVSAAADDDDDNFATSATSESQSYVTRLSPPPFQRSSSSDSMAQTITLSLAEPCARLSPSFNFSPVELAPRSPPRWSISLASGVGLSPTAEEPVGCYDLGSQVNDKNDSLAVLESPSALCRRVSLGGYSLPRLSEEGKTSPSSIPRGSPEVPISETNLLGGHVDSGLDDFAKDLGWIMEVIGNLRDY